MAKKPRSAAWHLCLTAVVLCCAVGYALYALWRALPHEEPPPEPAVAEELPPAPASSARQFADAFYEEVDRALEARGLWPALIRKERGEIDRIYVQVPADLPLAEVNLTLALAAQAHGGRVLRAVETQRDVQVEMTCGFDSLHTTSIFLKTTTQQRRTGQIALVIDDFGEHSRLYKRFCDLQQHVTLAILPNAGPVTAIADRARKNGHDLLIHLPMEPDDYPTQDPGNGAIMAHYSEGEVRSVLQRALKRIPHAVGFNNHMGSKITRDERIMRTLLAEAKKRQLLFLDSRTTSHSVAYDLAQSLGVPSLQRDVFIDEVDDRAAIEAALWNLAAQASRTGHAVGIGHDRTNTLLALERVLPRLEQRGFRFASLEQLIP